MNTINSLGVAAILALAVGCQSTRSTSSARHPTWAAHEEISRTYHTTCKVQARDPVVVFDNEATSRIYETCCPMVPDDAQRSANGAEVRGGVSWAAHEEISRTYSTGCPMIPDEQTSQRDTQDMPVASGTCNGAERDSDCVHCGS